MNSRFIQEHQLFLRALCEIAQRCKPSEEFSDICIQGPLPHLAEQAERASRSLHRSLSPRRPDTREEVKGRPAIEESSLKLLEGVVKRHIDERHPYLHPTEAPATPVLQDIYTLLVYGEALFDKHQRELLGHWNLLAESIDGNIPWEAALLGALVHNHACILRELHDKSDSCLPDLLIKKLKYWHVFAYGGLTEIRDNFQNDHLVIRNLALNVMIVTSQTTGGDSKFFSSRAAFLKNPEKPLTQIQAKSISELRLLLLNPEVRQIYKSVCTTPMHTITDAEYNEAICEFMGNMYCTELKQSLGLYGVTLTGRQVVIDNSEPQDSRDLTILKKAYRIIILLHEFAHFVLRVSTRTLKEFLATATPIPEGQPPSISKITPVRQVIQDNFPLDYPGEAGNLLENELFGKKPKLINLHAARILLEMAAHPQPLSIFKEEFGKANKLKVSESGKMGLERGRLGAGEHTMTFASCGMLQPRY